MFFIVLVITFGVIAMISLTIFCFRSSSVLGLFWYTLDFRYPHKKKSGGVRSGDHGGQATSPHLHPNLPEKCFHNMAMLSFEVWQVAPSCWNQATRINFISRNLGMR